jgi:serine/threonine-protein kinase
MPSLAGQQLDKYDMLEEVGHGGMAVVYRCRDTVLDREVAIKVLHPHLADREESRARLRREAITVAKLRHDNILEIFDYSGTDASESYIVTEFIHGVTLRDWLDARWQPRPAVAAMIVHRLCLALAHAHEFGVVHRDIKPENVMIREDGCLKLMDFGIAQILDHQKLTMTGQLLGSPAYMAPELISGKPIDRRTDLFSVGILLYQLATGQLPFSGRNPHEVLNRIADADYAPASSVNPMVDEDLEDILKRALAREPDHRYQTARALANELEDYLQAMGIEPSAAELRAYFNDAEEYVDQLDRRVCAHLLEKAEKANREGHGARALKLLSRVIELDAQNRRALEMIDQVRRRGRVMRQVLLAVGLVAGLGMVGAGAMLMGQKGSDPEPVARKRTDKRGKADASPPRDDEVPVPKVVDVQEPTPDETGGQQADGPVAGTETGAREPMMGDEDDPTRGNPVRAPRTFACRVQIENLPAARMTNFSLRVGADGRKVALDERGSATLEIPVKGEKVTLMGKRWGGSWTIEQRDCASGSVVHRASPDPAKLEFTDLPADLPRDKLVVECLEGCTQKSSYEKFQPVEIPAGQSSVTIKVRLQSAAYGIEDREYTLEPGSNREQARLGK